MKTKKSQKRKTAIHHKVRHHVRMAVVPHKKNQFRPHLIRRHGLAVLLVLVTTLVFGSNWLNTGSVLGREADITPSALLGNVNSERASHGASALRINQQLTRAAFLKAQDMLSQQYWAHNAPDGTTPWKWFAEVEYNYAFAGENLAKNFQSSQSTVNAWMASQKHRDNVLGEQYTEAGFAVVDGVLEGRQTTLIVGLFGAPAGEAAGAVAPVELGAQVGGMSVMSQFGVALQSMNPATLSSVMLLMFGSLVALSAHVYRRKMPFAVQRTWRYQHGIIKAGGLMSIAVLLLALYSGGQI